MTLQFKFKTHFKRTLSFAIRVVFEDSDLEVIRDRTITTLKRASSLMTKRRGGGQPLEDRMVFAIQK